jgi:hypothetical protein
MWEGRTAHYRHAKPGKVRDIANHPTALETAGHGSEQREHTCEWEPAPSVKNVLRNQAAARWLLARLQTLTADQHIILSSTGCSTR